VTENGLRWVWATPPDEALRALSGSLAAGELPAGLSLVKESRARSVWRAPDLGPGIILKHYRVTGGEAVKACLLPARAEREFRVMESFCRRGVPTVRPLAYAERRDGWRLVEAWFVGGLLPDAEPLSAALAEGDRDPVSLVTAAVELVAEMHAHPFFHRDLHAGNLLLDGGRLRVIDLHSVWRVARLSRRMRAENLARLLFSTRAFVALDDAPRLARVYARARGEAVDAWVLRLRRALDAFERDYVRGRSARCVKNTSEFVRDRLAEGRVFRRRAYGVERLRADVAGHADVVARRGAELLGDASASRVSRVGEVVVKEYRRAGVLAALRSHCGFGRARGAWKAARRLAVEDVPTPEALALLERPDGTAHLVTAWTPESRTLRQWLESDGERSDPRDRGRLALALGHLVGRLSRAGVRHDDLSTKNVLIAPGAAHSTRDLRTTPPPGLPRLELIDLDNLARTERHDAVALSRMLGQLGDVPPWVRRTDRRRFARGFSLGAGRSLPRWVVAAAEDLVRARQERRAARARPGR